MKIDLHCHTKSIRSGELQTRSVSETDFTAKIEDAGVKIIAITNHDVFDEQQFQTFQKAVDGVCRLWPGVELNIADTHGDYHLLVVVGPAKITEFSKSLGEVTKDKSGDFSVDIDTVIAAFDPLDAIFLPHFGGKQPAITQEGLNYLSSKLKNQNRLILEDSNSRSTSILACHGMNTVTGSDVKDWATYQDADLSELRLPVDNFEQFCMFLDRDPTIIKNLLDKNNPVSYSVQPCEEDNSITVPITVYREVNIIFGDKGTGKSQIIKSIEKKMIANGITVALYVSSEKETQMEHLLDTADMQRMAGKLGIEDHAEEFQLINNWGDREPTSLQSYIDYAKSKNASSNKDRIKWVMMQATAYDVRKLASATKDLRDVDGAINTIRPLESKYLKEDKTKELDGLLTLLHEAVDAKYEEQLVEKYSSQLIHKSLEKIRTLVTAKTGTVPKPMSTGLLEYALNRIDLCNAADKILQNMLPKEALEHDLLGNIGGKGAVYITKRWKMYDDNDSRHDEYKGEPKITVLKEARAHLKSIKRKSFTNELDDALDEFREDYKNGIDRTSVFVGVKKFTTDKTFRPYKLSNGEKSIVLIQRKLNQEADAYLLDEPELSMSNSYIDEVIRPRISELGKQRRIVVIATHNANLAVRTLPYSSTYRSHSGEGYKTYVGNPFLNKLTNINDGGDGLDWKEVSMLVLEGGEEAFNDRGEIYDATRR